MYSPGQILYFTPYYFPNGNPSKNKYFVVLAYDNQSLIVGSLPTSKDHIPPSLPKEHGCIHNETMQIGCYFFESNRIISECGTFSFPLDTYLYAEQVDLFDLNKLNEIYQTEDVDYQILGKLSDS
ncbi:hypothetical protein LJC35_06100, partial [Parabacteroides sp. OttesenSCG-928-N08]|nr:hypothetical protein [Parabacteroides sp. OttesenSCG-928-N08]